VKQKKGFVAGKTPTATSQYNKIVLCCLSGRQEREHCGRAPLVFISEGVWVCGWRWGVRLCSPRGIYSKLGGGIYWDTGALSPSCGSLVLPNMWWCPLSTVPSAAWCGVDGISPATRRPLPGANIPVGWLCGCIMADFGAPGSHPPAQRVGRANPWVITRCAQCLGDHRA